MTDKEKSFEMFYREGTQLLHQGKAIQATEYLEQANRLQPDDVDAGLNLSSAYILSGKFKWAVTLLEKLSDQDSDNPMIWTNLGAAYLGNPVLAGDQDQLKAIKAFEIALEIDPVAPNVAYNLGLIYKGRKNEEQATHWFRQAIKANPNDFDAQSQLDRLTIEGPK